MIGLIVAALLQRAPLPLPYVAPLIEPVPPRSSTHLVTFDCPAATFSLAYGRGGGGLLTLGPVTRASATLPPVEVPGGSREDLKPWAARFQSIGQVTPTCMGTGALIYMHTFKEQRESLYVLWINDEGVTIRPA